MKTSTKVYSGIVLLAAASRLVPHAPNFSVIGSLALFGGACFEETLAAFAIPIAAMLLSDAVIGFHREMPVVYLSFILTTFLGRLVNSKSVGSVASMSVAAAVLFFALTNFGVWAG